MTNAEWTLMQDDQQEEKRQLLQRVEDELAELEREGVDVRRCDVKSRHYKIGHLNIWPGTAHWMNDQTKEKGSIHGLAIRELVAAQHKDPFTNPEVTALRHKLAKAEQELEAERRTVAEEILSASEHYWDFPSFIENTRRKYLTGR